MPQEGAVLAALDAELGGQHHLVPAAGDRLADQPLVGERAVHVGGVEEGDAEVQGAVDGPFGLLLVAGAVELAHPHAAEPLGRNGQAAQCPCAHARLLPGGGAGSTAGGRRYRGSNPGGTRLVGQRTRRLTSGPAIPRECHGVQRPSRRMPGGGEPAAVVPARRSSPPPPRAARRPLPSRTSWPGSSARSPRPRRRRCWCTAPTSPPPAPPSTATGMRPVTEFERIGVAVASGTAGQIQAARTQPGVTYLEGNSPIASSTRRRTPPPAAPRPRRPSPARTASPWTAAASRSR